MSPPRKAIVMVDDEKSYVDLLAVMLTENLGCTVHTFTRPREALAALPGLEVGVVITDYCMPQLNGLEFIQQASRLLPDKTPFILISGHPIDIAENQIGGSAPLRAILPKPFGWRRLAETIVLHAPEFASPTVRVAAAPAPL